MRHVILAGLAIAVTWTSLLSHNHAATPATNNNQNRPVAYSRMRDGESRKPQTYERVYSWGSPDPRCDPRSSGRRDPFRLPPPSSNLKRSKTLPPAYLPAGKLGLMIDRLSLKGVLWNDSGRVIIAIVTNKTQRAYFLQPNDRVYDGIVTRITPDAIYFRQRVFISRGVSIFRSVVKQLSGSERGLP